MVMGTRIDYTYEVHGTKEDCEAMAAKIVALANFVRDNTRDRNDGLVRELTALRDSVSIPEAIHEHKLGDRAFTKYSINGTHVLEIPFTVDEHEKSDRVSATWSCLGELFEKAADWMLTYCLDSAHDKFMKLGVFEFMGFARFMARKLSMPITDALKHEISEATKSGRLTGKEVGKLLYRALPVIQYGDSAERSAFGYGMERLIEALPQEGKKEK